MTIRMDHAGFVVEDLAAAIAFFVELGLELEGRTTVEGAWVDQLFGLEGVRGIPRLTFEIDSVDAVFDRLRPHGAELVGEVAQYEPHCRYGYVRGPAGVIIGLVEKLD